MLIPHLQKMLTYSDEKAKKYNFCFVYSPLQYGEGKAWNKEGEKLRKNGLKQSVLL